MIPCRLIDVRNKSGLPEAAAGENTERRTQPSPPRHQAAHAVSRVGQISN
jgi:hypothetical protein